jgi:hypothetical protein
MTHTSLLSALLVSLAVPICTINGSPEAAAPEADGDAEAPATPPAPPQTRPDEHFCSAVGCESAVSVFAHLREPVATLRRGRASFHVCRRHQCWDGVLQPQKEGSPAWPCSVPSSFAIQLRCQIADEGSGSKLTIAVVDAEPFEDGDAVSLRVTLAGRTLIDHTRHVTYGEDSPNGRECGPVCRNAGVEVWPGAPSGVTCGPQICNPAVRFESMRPVTREGAGRTRVAACRNDDCQSNTDGTILYDWDNAKDEPIPRANGGAGFASVGGARVSIKEWSLSRPKTSPYHVEIEFIGDPRTYEPGDRYSVEFQSLDGKVLLHMERVVERYDEWVPGGPRCSAVTCRGKTFEK